MKQTEEFDTILDECLESILGGESVRACLERHPDHAEELRPLLETAFQAKDAADVAPRPEFRQEASRQFQQALHDLPVRKAIATFSFRHWWVSAVAVLAVIILGGGGTVFAATSAQPDNFLYSVKLATESVRISLAGSDQGKAELYAQFAARRVDEIIAMAAKGDAAAVAKATDHLDSQLVAMAGVVGGNEESAMMASKADEGALRAPATTQATMTATPTTTATTPPSLAVPSPTSRPSPTAPAPTVTFTQSAPSGTGDVSIAGGEASSFEADVAAQATEAAQKLVDALGTAPEAAREGLEHALEVVTSGYDNVLNGLNH